ncbi:MAG: T9SS type A sorting domain-containing protein [Flavobacteriales bacterium]|nr:T9SS type A sorting domain-containing protein [Flavobacteriales bacterium]
MKHIATLVLSLFCLLSFAQSDLVDERIQLELYPNPAPKGDLKIRTDFRDVEVDAPIIIDVRDIIGNQKLYRTVYNSKFVDQALDPEGVLTSGVYVITVALGNRVKSERVIVK